MLTRSFQLVLLKERQDLIDAQAVFDVLLRLAQDIDDRLPLDQVPRLLRPQQGVLVVVLERVHPALADVVVALLQGLLAGPLFEVQLVRAVLALNGHLVAGRPLASLSRIGGRALLGPARR